MIVLDLRKDLHGAAGPVRLCVQTQIEAGSLVALYGPSGAGKTTVLRMLAGLLAPDSGRIEVAGKCWFDAQQGINLPPQQRAIGFVFQDYALFPNLSVRENVAYGAAKGEAAWVDELLALTDLRALQDRLPAMLSGGQKQRVALARALARKPALLLLDEALSALDASMRAQLQEVLARLHACYRPTTLLVSHDLGDVFRLAQRVLHLDGGRIARDGSPAELFLQQRMSGKFNLRGQVLAVRREDVVHIVSLLVGQEIIEVIASDDEAAQLRPGDAVSVSSKAFNPMLFKVD
jgi:molybdate transport system ATP-binding protein